MNKKVLVLGLFAIFFIKNCFGMLNPAAVYCEAMGYKYLQEEGLCELSNGERVSDWDFLEGKVAQDYSYCSKQGYQIKTINDPNDKCLKFLTEECAVCILPNGTEIEVTDLMELNFREGVCGDGRCVLGESYENCPEDCPKTEPEEATEEKIQEETPKETPEIPVSKEEKICGNNFCDAQESYKNCPEDCPSGSKDGYCDMVKDGICDPDCMQGEDSDCPAKKEEVKVTQKESNNVGFLFIASTIFVTIIIILVLIAIFKRKPKSFIQEKVENLQEQK
ncbi:MAG: DUF333 domain-containing protein [Candidatus Woesearchaeota archaeon]